MRDKSSPSLSAKRPAPVKSINLKSSLRSELAILSTVKPLSTAVPCIKICQEAAACPTHPSHVGQRSSGTHGSSLVCCHAPPGHTMHFGSLFFTVCTIIFTAKVKGCKRLFVYSNWFHKLKFLQHASDFFKPKPILPKLIHQVIHKVSG